jgi:putative transposase
LRRPLESAQYTSFDYTQELTDHHVLASIGSVGDAYDNALAESFVDSFKSELIADRVWRSRSQLELAVVEWLGWFNHTRLHSALGFVPPAEHEARSLSESEPLELPALSAQAAQALSQDELPGPASPILGGQVVTHT